MQRAVHADEYARLMLEFATERMHRNRALPRDIAQRESLPDVLRQTFAREEIVVLERVRPYGDSEARHRPDFLGIQGRQSNNNKYRSSNPIGPLAPSLSGRSVEVVDATSQIVPFGPGAAAKLSTPLPPR